MCGRFVQLAFQFPDQVPWPEIADDLIAITAKYNLSPTQRAAVVMDDGGKKAVKKFRWGLIPRWAKDLKGTFKTINARVETVSELPSYRLAFKAPRRCLIPMAGYYEWRDYPDGKQPFYITRKDGETLYAAGLWEPRHPLQDEGEDGSCTLITHDAVDVAIEVHDRMPVFLDHSLANDWMTAQPNDAMALLLAAKMPELIAFPVSRHVNNSRHRGGAELIAPVDL